MPLGFPGIGGGGGGSGSGDVSQAGTQTFSGQNTFSLSPIVPVTDLGAISGSNALTINTHYQGTQAVAATLTISGTPVEGSTTSIKLLVSAVVTLTIPSCKRIGETNTAITSLLLFPGNHIFFFRYVKGEYVLTDSVGLLHNYAATTAPTANEDIGDGYTVGSRWLDTTNKNIYELIDSTVTAAVWKWLNPLQCLRVAFDPKAVCDGAIDRLFLATVGVDLPAGVIVHSWKFSFEADPTTEIDLDLKRADAFIGVANSAVMDQLDTTAGVSSEGTAANVNSGAAVANAKVIYLEFGTAYTEANHQCIFEMWYRSA